MRDKCVNLRIVLSELDFNAGYTETKNGVRYTHEVYRTFRHKDEMYGMAYGERVVSEDEFMKLFPEHGEQFIDAMTHGKSIVNVFCDIDMSKDSAHEYVDVGTRYLHNWQTIECKATDTDWYEEKLYKNWSLIGMLKK